MDREERKLKRQWGNVESESLSIFSFSLHFLIISPFAHSLSISSPFADSLSISSLFSNSPLSRSQAARLPQFVQPCYVAKFTDLMFPISDLIRLCSGFGHLLPCNCYIFNKIGLFLQILLSTNHRPYLQVSLSCGSSVVAAGIVVLGNGF